MSLNLRVQGLSIGYDSVPILDGIDFELHGGEMVALLGPNGAGKSTLMRCISRALDPSKGTVLFNGREAGSLSAGEIARQLAVVPQDTGVDFDFTVEEVIRMGRFPHDRGFGKKKTEQESIVLSAMEITGILPLRYRSAATLSGGERQRMVFARALCQEPKLLLLDEPTANLDIGYQWELLDIVLRLNQEKKVTVIAAIHDLNLATLFFRQFILLTGGKVLAIGSAEEVLTEENILSSYGVKASIFRHPLHGRLQVSVGKESMRPMQKRSRDEEKRVHVIGGGQEALPVIEALWENEYSLSLGPVSREDSGYHFAGFFDIPVIENPPFSGISDQMYQEHLKLMHESKWIVLPPISFGEGNLRNLEAMSEAITQGIPGIVIGEQVEERDFTGGKASALLKQLRELGAVFVKDTAAVLNRIKKQINKN
ncbi:MAG: ABC transporter ATP-binding protein [Desulfitobacteriaceae bacterium]|nr:ABC transporter ATP-binding protein [Desulfitobacteriaceae bacterium]MDD4347252.1 ABC transporter ATP-binding protein [Desulfitobacteriaceae bacterium]MDD4401046.1 ABC transporter ATP-binding protein [Desulfitobacteriaceae bacterium]